MMLPELYYNAKATLGEGPAWDAKTQTLYWIDVLEKRIYAGPKLFLQLDEFVGCLAPRKDGGLVIAQRFGFWTFEPNTKKLITLASPKGEPSNNRFNDGKCDARGRFVAGTMDHNEQESSGSLYSLSPGGPTEEAAQGRAHLQRPGLVAGRQDDVLHRHADRAMSRPSITTSTPGRSPTRG